MNKIAITRREHFNAAHRLHNHNWSIEKNKEVFGKCNNENYHGHNYDLEVKVIGTINEDTGYIVLRKFNKKASSQTIKALNSLKNLGAKNII